ncbi:MAG: hypothetical protein MZV64_17720 [Ignavibacteriales bacterium]|nr:hypothetical protein [Ignavibacteriales bacterium]
MPEPGHAGDADQLAQRDVDVNVFQVVGACARRWSDALPLPLRRFFGTGDLLAPERYAPGQRLRVRQNLLRRAFGDDLSAVFARAGTEVDHPICSADGLVVVLDDQHGVAQVAQSLERVQQAGVVARVQADRRLIQHVQHAHQPRADLRRQADALRLAARERAGRAVAGSGNPGPR